MVRRWFFWFGLLFLVACSTSETPVVTEVVMVDGEDQVVTRVVPATLEVLVTPLPDVELVDRGREPVVLNIGLVDDRDTFLLDPQRSSDETTLLLVENLFAGLTRYNPATGSIEPEIAGSWELQADGLTWRFFLRPDVYWLARDPNDEETVQPLRPVDAQDFVFAWRRACDRRTQIPDAFLFFLIAGCQELHQITTPTNTDLNGLGVRAVDDFVLDVTLTQPANYFLAMTSMVLLRPLPREQVQSLGEEWALPENVVTSGPFLWSNESLMGTRIILRRSPVWDVSAAGNVDIVNLFQFDNRTDPYTLWQEGSLDIAPVPTAVTAEERFDLGSQLKHVPVHELFYLGFNFDSPVFRDVEMRRAFAAAIDTQALVDELYDGMGFPMRHLTPPSTVGGLPFDVVGTGYSPDYARREFAASGLPSCRLLTPVTLLTTTSDEALQQAEALQQMWRLELGCDEDVVRIEQAQFGTLLANTRQDAAALRPDMWILGWSAYYPDAYNWLTTILHCNESENRPRRPCSSVDELLSDAAATPDLVEQAERYRAAENQFFGEDGIQPVAPLFLRGRYEVAQIWVLYTPTPVGGPRFDRYEVDADLRTLERGQ